jgi:hypothetical protein
MIMLHQVKSYQLQIQIVIYINMIMYNLIWKFINKILINRMLYN